MYLICANIFNVVLCHGPIYLQSLEAWLGKKVWTGWMCLLSTQPFDVCCPLPFFFSYFTLIPSQHPAERSGCRASSAPPPGLRSGASGAGCHSLPQTRHWSRPEGWWASWRRLWLLLLQTQGSKKISGGKQLPRVKAFDFTHFLQS